MADVISNLRAIAVSPPAGWSAERKLGYLEGCRQLVDAGRGTEASIEQIFDETAADVERAIRDDAPFSINGREVVARHLDSEIGQAVHLVYLPNTEGRNLEAADMDRLCQLIEQDSPRPQFSRPRQFTRAGDDRFLSPALEPTAPMPSLILLSASVSLSIRNLSVSRSEDDISEFMETIPHSVVVRMQWDVPCYECSFAQALIAGMQAVQNEILLSENWTSHSIR